MVKLLINGKQHTADVEKDMPLLWVLRDILNLTGTKYGCGKGLCGSCKILLDGKAVQSCILPVSAAEGKTIITIEGESENLQLLQQAWVEENVSQCGFCQPGQLLTATSLLDKNPNPSEEEIENAMNGNICRCGTYTRIKKAINKVVEHKNQ